MPILRFAAKHGCSAMLLKVPMKNAFIERLAQTKLCAATLLLLNLTKKKTASLEALTPTK